MKADLQREVDISGLQLISHSGHWVLVTSGLTGSSGLYFHVSALLWVLCVHSLASSVCLHFQMFCVSTLPRVLCVATPAGSVCAHSCGFCVSILLQVLCIHTPTGSVCPRSYRFCVSTVLCILYVRTPVGSVCPHTSVSCVSTNVRVSVPSCVSALSCASVCAGRPTTITFCRVWTTVLHSPDRGGS